LASHGSSFQKVFMGAAGSGGATGSYIALIHSTSPYFTLLDHTTPGSVSSAATFTLDGPPTTFGALDFSPDGSYIAMGNKNAYFTLLDHTTAGSVSLKSKSQSLTDDDPEAISVSPDGNYIAVGHVTKVNLLNFSNPSSLSVAATYTFSGSANKVRDVAFSPDGKYIAVAHQSNPRLTLLDHTTAGSLSLADTVEPAIQVASGDFFGGYSTAFSPDGNYIAVGLHGNGGNKEIVLLDHTTDGTMAIADTFDVAGAVWGLAFSPDGNYLAVAHASSPFFTLLDHTTAGSLSSADTQTISANQAYSVAFSPDGKYIAVGHNSTSSTKFTLLDHTTAGSVSISDTFTGTGIGHQVAFSPN